MMNQVPVSRIIKRKVNFVPESVRLENKYEKKRKSAEKYLKFGAIGLLFLVFMEFGLYLFFSGITVPVSLEKEYQTAKNEIEKIDKEIAVIDKSKSEDQKPIVALSAILNDKPFDVKFSTVEIGQTDGAKSQVWVKFDVVSTNPILFNQYALKLSQNNDIFNGAVVNKITSAENGIKKTAVIMIGRR